MRNTKLAPQVSWSSVDGELLDALPELTASADRIEQSGESLAADLARLARAGLFTAAMPTELGGLGLGLGHAAGATLWTATVLRRLGRANLSLARLYEGHLNALKLVDRLAPPMTRRRLLARAAAGALFGIWGADGRSPARLEQAADGSLRLQGAKAFASGLGLVERALVTARLPGDPGEVQLVAIAADDVARQHPEEWTASAMRATRSGGFVLDGMVVQPDDRIGGPGEYLAEPHFEGGIWRYSAAHVGGAEALIETLRQSLVSSGRALDAHQLGRLARAAAWCEAARRAVEAAALAVEASDGGPPAAIDAAVAQALAARQVVEEVCVEVLMLVERSLGVRAHVEGSRIERQRRDLGLYLRQAAPDAKLLEAGRRIVAAEAAIGELW